MTITGAAPRERMLRIGFFLPHFAAGGIERVILNLLMHLDRRAFATTLILGRREGDLLPSVPHWVEVVDLGGIKMRWMAPKLRRLLRQLQLDVVYSGTNAANLALLSAGATMRSRPALIVSEHTLGSLFLREAKWRWLRTTAMRALYPKADLIITPLADLGIELRSVLRRPDLPVRELLNPLFDARMVAHPTAPTNPDASARGCPYFVAAGRLAKVKDYDLLLRAFATLSRERPGPHLVMLGDGEERSALERLAANLGIADRVDFEGFVDRPIEVFRQAVALVISSHREGTPNVIPEAMAAGTAVIAKDCSIGVHRLLQGGRSGMLLQSPTPEDLAAAMRTLIDEPARRAELIAAGLRLAQHFSFQETIPRYAQTFVDAASRRIDRNAPVESLLRNPSSG